jgi:uncharacterized protein
MESTLLTENKDFLNEKVEFLKQANIYPDTTKVEAVETHMSWVFLTDHKVYKLKKPVCYQFLDFRTIEARYKFCQEEVKINQTLAPGVYLGVIPITFQQGEYLQLKGNGEIVDWLVKMKRLPEEFMLQTVLKTGKVRNDWVQKIAEILTDFYLTSSPVKVDPHQCRQQIIKDIELNSTELLRSEFNLPKSMILNITMDLLYFVVKHFDIIYNRVEEGKVVETHGDLKPEHICLAPKPVIIDRLEFNRDLRIMDIAEELSYLALECEMLSSPATGQLFFNVYKWKSHDQIPDVLIFFYKAKKALLRARLTIRHLLEKKYLKDENKWRNRSAAYLQMAYSYCEKLAINK